MSTESKTEAEKKRLLDKINAKTISESEFSEDRIVFYVGINDHLTPSVVKTILAHERFHNAIVLAAPDDVVTLKHEGIKAYDASLAEDIDGLDILSLKNLELKDPLQKAIRDFNDNLHKPDFKSPSKKANFDHGVIYPQMSKKKGGHRHRFIRNLK